MSFRDFVKEKVMSEDDFVAKLLDEKVTTEAYLRVRYKWENNQATWAEVHEEYIKTPIGIKTMEDRKLNGANHGRLFV